MRIKLKSESKALRSKDQNDKFKNIFFDYCNKYNNKLSCTSILDVFIYVSLIKCTHLKSI